MSRKYVQEGKPRATNRSRVNAITVQCKVGSCWPNEDYHSEPIVVIHVELNLDFW